MFLITDKNNNLILDWCEEEMYSVYGDPMNAGQNMVYSMTFAQGHIVDSIPEEVKRGLYCYTGEDGFYVDPNYEEPNPYGIPDDLLERIKNDTITEVEEAVLNGTDE